jgi:RNA polymerase sigma-70 factor (ECF subfamily)
LERERELALIERAVEGDEQAFAELVYATQDLVYSCCIKVLRNPQLAEEAANEAFLRAWRGLAGFRAQARFSSWMFRIAHNAAVRMATKKRLKTISIDDEDKPGLANVARDNPRAERNIEGRSELQLVRDLLDELPENHRKALELAYLEGVSYADAAAALGCTTGTIKTWVHRGRNKLRELYLEATGREFA